MKILDKNSLPSSIQAEKAALGCLLLEPNLWDDLATQIEEKDFTQTENKIIYRAIKKLSDQGTQLDTLTLIEAVSSDEEIKKNSNLNFSSYIKDLFEETPGTSNFSNYVDIVKQTSSLRKLIETADEISSTAFTTDSFSSDDAITKAEDKILKLRDSIERKSGPQIAKDLVGPVYENIDINLKSSGPLVGHSTGFKYIDNLTMGLQKGDLFIIAGRPGMGKTAFAMSIACNLLIDEVPVLLFSMEMSSRSIMYRLFSSFSRVDFKRLQEAKNLSDEDFRDIDDASTMLSKSKLFIDDTPGLSPSELISRARKVKRENPDLGLIIIDYLQLMNSDRNSENRVTEMSEISRSVKSLARDLDITVIALSQLNRAVENRNNKRPLMSDLRESGALEQDADLVAFVYRDEYYNETPENKGLAEVNIAKHRNGKTGKVKLHFASNIIKFENLADNDPAMSMPTNYED